MQEILVYFFTNSKTKFPIYSQLFAIYTLYSIYYTQISEEFYQINITLEFLNEINNLILSLNNCNNEKFVEISYEIYMMVKKLKKDNATIWNWDNDWIAGQLGQKIADCNKLIELMQKYPGMLVEFYDSY